MADRNHIGTMTMARRNNTQTSVTTMTANEQAKAAELKAAEKMAHEKAKAEFLAGKEDKRNAFFDRAYLAGMDAAKGAQALTDVALDWQLEILTDESGMTAGDAKDIYMSYGRGYMQRKANGARSATRLELDAKSIKSQVSILGTFALPGALHLVGSQHRVEIDDETMTVYDLVIRLVDAYGSKELAGGVYACMAKVNRAANKLLGDSQSDKAKAAMLAVIDAPWVYDQIAKAGSKDKSALQRVDAWAKAGETLYEKHLGGYTASATLLPILGEIAALRSKLAAEIERLTADIEAERAIEARANEEVNEEEEEDIAA